MAEKEYISIDTAYDIGTLDDWYINSVSQDDAPVWTEEHLEELLNDFYVIPKDTPTADVVPVKHGHWEYDKHFRFARCSECEAEFYICDLEEISGGNLVNYCPNCGAKMDGGDENE